MVFVPLATKANFDHEILWDELEEYAKRYYGEIMLPFRGAGQKALEKLKALEIKKIAPSHGLIYTNPEKIMISYSSWASGKFAKHVLIVYVSMWGTTEKMAKELDVPVIALSQLSRPSKFALKAKSHRPNLEDLRDSGNIEQDAHAGRHPAQKPDMRHWS